MFCKAMFYKYAACLNIVRHKACNRRKNHSQGLRASHVLQYIHADITLFKTVDNLVAYIYVVIDNYSRKILNLKVHSQKRASLMFDCLNEVYEQYIKPVKAAATLITDDGCENQGQVSELINDNRYKQHWIAQRDIVYSNSMVESTNKQLKYYDLYTKEFAHFDALKKHEQLMINNHNQRPRIYLNHLTPDEVFNGLQTDKQARSIALADARKARSEANRANACQFPTC
jgi:putative transposase